MRYIDYKKIVNVISSLCIDVAYDLPADVLDALKTAAQKETNSGAADILKSLIENARIAKEQMIPLCQDTGLAVVFIAQGSEVLIKSQNSQTIIDAINQGVTQGYQSGYLRKSVVAEPLNERKNTNTNTPCIIHHSIVPGDKIKFTLMAKGGGCENKSQFKMFNPTADRDQVIDWVVDVVKQAGANACPPFVVGVGMGGDFELSVLLSKKAILRTLDEPNSEEYYAKLEEDLLNKINSLNLGPQGFGGDTTALGCKIETAACHIASLPVAVNIECHSHRHKTIIL